MPAGVGWGPYLRYTVAAMLSMFAGAQVVHQLYHPMDDFDKYVEEALRKDEQERAKRTVATVASSSTNKKSSEN